MKSAEEWIQEILLSDTSTVNDIKKIQLDAWKQGMTDAAKTCDEDSKWTWVDHNCAVGISEELLKMRDDKQSL